MKVNSKFSRKSNLFLNLQTLPKLNSPKNSEIKTQRKPKIELKDKFIRMHSKVFDDLETLETKRCISTRSWK